MDVNYVIYCHGDIEHFSAEDVWDGGNRQCVIYPLKFQELNFQVGTKRAFIRSLKPLLILLAEYYTRCMTIMV